MSNVKIMYRASKGFGGAIEQVEVVKSTPYRVTLNELRSGMKPVVVARESNHSSYFDTWDEAKKWLIEGAQRDVDRYAANLSRATEYLERVKSISE